MTFVFTTAPTPPSSGSRNTGCKSAELRDAIAQTAKHHTRRQSGDPITAVVVKLFADQAGIHADIAWTSNAGRNGQTDALKLADLCVAEWEAFFQQKNLDPKS